MKYFFLTILIALIFFTGFFFDDLKRCAFNEKKIECFFDEKKDTESDDNISDIKFSFDAILKLETFEVKSNIPVEGNFKKLKGNPVSTSPEIYGPDRYDVSIKIGKPILVTTVDLTQMRVVNKNDKNKTIRVRLPESKITRAYAGNSDVIVNVTARYPPVINTIGQPSDKEKNKKINVLLDRIKSQAEAHGILERSQRQAEEFLRSYASDFNYSVEFE